MAAERRGAGPAALGALALAAFLALAPAAANGTPYRADGKLGEWRGRPANIAGASQVSRGELIHTDYLYDDYGPDLDGAPNATSFRSSAPTSGDHRYPADAASQARYGNNGADLRELRLAVDRRGFHALVSLQTMLDPGAAVVTIAIDADGKRSTGSGEWPAVPPPRLEPRGGHPRRAPHGARPEAHGARDADRRRADGADAAGPLGPRERPARRGSGPGAVSARRDRPRAGARGRGGAPAGDQAMSGFRGAAPGGRAPFPAACGLLSRATAEGRRPRHRGAYTRDVFQMQRS